MLHHLVGRLVVIVSGELRGRTRGYVNSMMLIVLVGEQRLDGSEKSLQLVILEQFARLCACSCEHL